MLRPTFDLYVQLRPGRVTVESPDLGRSAEASGPGFSHPRLPVGDFGAAHSALSAAVASVRPSRLYKVRRVLVHIQHDWNGGVTEVELRAIKDLAVDTTGTFRINIYVRPADLSETDVRELLDAKPGSRPGLIS